MVDNKIINKNSINGDNNNNNKIFYNFFKNMIFFYYKHGSGPH